MTVHHLATSPETVHWSHFFRPVGAAGAVFGGRRARAVQGDGEVCLTAIETVLTGTFRFILHKRVRLIRVRTTQ